LLRTGLNRPFDYAQDRFNPERYRPITMWGKALPAVEVIPLPMFLAIIGRVLNVVHHHWLPETKGMLPIITPFPPPQVLEKGWTLFFVFTDGG
jgi:hypothetical protein